MEKRIYFGKVDYNHIGRKINPVYVTIKLNDTCNGPVFTASGEIYNQSKTDCHCCGQCLDTIARHLKGNQVFMMIYDLWKKYHLNDMHAGTPEQESFVDNWKRNGGKQDYYSVCTALKDAGLYEVEHNGKPYRYGSSWLYQEIPVEDINAIKHFIKVL